jgi:glycosyltransferase involved in cell wall biosynthesis
VVFAGFLDAQAVSRTLAGALAMILPSLRDQWGLVVNEAVSLNIPVLCTDNPGARDTLVRTGVNGFIFEPGNTEGLAVLMGLLSDDPALWRRMSLACADFAPLTDSPVFAAGVGRLIGAAPAEAASAP